MEISFQAPRVSCAAQIAYTCTVYKLYRWTFIIRIDIIFARLMLKLRLQFGWRRKFKCISSLSKSRYHSELWNILFFGTDRFAVKSLELLNRFVFHFFSGVRWGEAGGGGGGGGYRGKIENYIDEI